MGANLIDAGAYELVFYKKPLLIAYANLYFIMFNNTLIL